MVRAPCCEKMGLKKGPWSPEEDQILVNYIRLHGHSNWRALPKLAGLLRCGKSCRLRWTNYLRPDIRRGNFSREEEETIIQLHRQLGNRWSAIAGRLPGRTDNEIKNVWHTHLKKRVLSQQQTAPTAAVNSDGSWVERSSESQRSRPLSPQACSSDGTSSVITNAGLNGNCSADDSKADLATEFPEMDEEFWSEVLSADTSGTAAGSAGGHAELEFPSSDEFLRLELPGEGMEFWYDLFAEAGELPEFSEF